MKLRRALEQQLMRLKREAGDPDSGVSKMSNLELLLTIKRYLEHFNCETLTNKEIRKLLSKMESDTNTKITS